MLTKMTNHSVETFTLVTDSGSDLPLSYLNAEHIRCISLGLYFESDEILINDNEISSKKFYERIRGGETSKTSAPNPNIFEHEFRKVLDKGKDILYIGFSSSLSTTFNSGKIAAEELREEYPDRTILVLDSLCASAGQGLLVAMTKQKINEGYALMEAYDFAVRLAPRISHRFTVDTLTYLCRGGRVSKSAMMAGNLLNIKPVLHMNDNGQLINIFKARGRAKSLSMLADAYAETALSLHSNAKLAVGAENIEFSSDEYSGGNDMIMISHADCIEDAEKLANMIKTRFNKEVDLICDIGPVIGSHSGPGTVALFFVASKR